MAGCTHGSPIPRCSRSSGSLRLVSAGAGAIGFTLAATSISIVLFVVELVWPLVAEERVIGDPEVASDIGHTALANGVAQVTDAAMLAVGAIVAGRLGATWGVHLWPVGWPFVGQVIVLVVVADGLVYWLHRLEHRVSWLWRIHALHHDVERLHVIKSGRNTFVDMALRSLAVYGPLAALGAPPEVIVWHPLVLLVLGPIGHANVALPVPDVVHRLIVTPQGHRVHHAKDHRLADGNFAVVTPLWDVLFGTFIDPTGTHGRRRRAARGRLRASGAVAAQPGSPPVTSPRSASVVGSRGLRRSRVAGSSSTGGAAPASIASIAGRWKRSAHDASSAFMRARSAGRLFATSRSSCGSAARSKSSVSPFDVSTSFNPFERYVR
jgi:sterol desaturase/sphingolipid hydroxylase (fatty acid hydroxylase superfamily)